MILREQVASIWTGVHNLGNEFRLLRLLVEGSQDAAAHLAQQRQIQDQAATLVQYRAVMAEQDALIQRCHREIEDARGQHIPNLVDYFDGTSDADS